MTKEEISRRWRDAHPDYNHDYYLAHKDDIIQRTKQYTREHPEYLQARDARRQAWFDELRSLLLCEHCGGFGMSLHFHHRDPRTKVAAVSSVIRQSNSRIMSEMARCDVLCRSCHRKAHIRLQTQFKDKV